MIYLFYKFRNAFFSIVAIVMASTRRFVGRKRERERDDSKQEKSNRYFPLTSY